MALQTETKESLPHGQGRFSPFFKVAELLLILAFDGGICFSVNVIPVSEKRVRSPSVAGVSDSPTDSDAKGYSVTCSLLRYDVGYAHGNFLGIHVARFHERVEIHSITTFIIVRGDEFLQDTSLATILRTFMSRNY